MILSVVRKKNTVMCLASIETKNDSAGEDQQQFTLPYPTQNIAIWAKIVSFDSSIIGKFILSLEVPSLFCYGVL
jgi:hypothetical protein